MHIRVSFSPPGGMQFQNHETQQRTEMCAVKFRPSNQLESTEQEAPPSSNRHCQVVSLMCAFSYR